MVFLIDIRLIIRKTSKGGIVIMKKYKYLLISIVVFAGLLCGCGSNIPEMSEAQEAVVTEYATNLLVKYSPLTDRALLNEDQLEAGIVKEAEEWERLMKTKELEKAYLDAAEKGETLADNPEQGENVSNEETVEMVPQRTVSEFFAEDSISIDYVSYLLCDSYPENSEEEFFMAMDAAAGKQLCVVTFAVRNLSGTEQSLNMLGKQGRFSLQIDGGAAVQAQSTLLMDDLSSYAGVIPANGEEQLVLVFEVSDGVAQIGSMDLIMNNSQGENRLTLQ